MADEGNDDIKRERLEVENEMILNEFINHSVGVKRRGKHKMHQAAEKLRFFANEYLLNYHEENLLEGLSSFRSFVGDWFIRKCMWSDEASVRENLAAYDAFLTYLKETDHLPEGQDEGHTIDQNERSLFQRRAKYYNEPEIKLEDILDEFGMWDDKAIQKLEGKSRDHENPIPPGQECLTFNLLFSARAAKLFSLKAPELMSLRTWESSWEDPAHHWISSWRIEDCFGMKGTKERVFIITNEASRFSFLLRIAPGRIEPLLKIFAGKLLQTLKNQKVHTPKELQYQFRALSGAAPSLTSQQNNHRFQLDAIIDSGNFEYLDDLENRLNLTPTRSVAYAFPINEFSNLCQEDPPFQDPPAGDNIIPFLN